MNTNGPILYAEDDDNDVFLIKRAFRQAGVARPLQVVPDGQQAIDYLKGTGQFSNREQYPLPCLVLLDLKMPGKSGFDILNALRAHAETVSLPALVLTSSNQNSDIERSYSLGANGYLIKPGRPDELLQLVKRIKDFWLDQTPVAATGGGLPCWPAPIP